MNIAATNLVIQSNICFIDFTIIFIQINCYFHLCFKIVIENGLLSKAKKNWLTLNICILICILLEKKIEI